MTTWTLVLVFHYSCFGALPCYAMTSTTVIGFHSEQACEKAAEQFPAGMCVEVK